MAKIKKINIEYAENKLFAKIYENLSNKKLSLQSSLPAIAYILKYGNVDLNDISKNQNIDIASKNLITEISNLVNSNIILEEKEPQPKTDKKLDKPPRELTKKEKSEDKNDDLANNFLNEQQ